MVFDLILGLPDAFFQRWRILTRRAGLRIAGEKLEHLQQLDRSMRRVSGCDCQFQAFPVSGEFAVLAIGIAEVLYNEAELNEEERALDIWYLAVDLSRAFFGFSPGAAAAFQR
jgi:hypothetical protein